MINGKDETIMSALVEEDEGCKSSWSNVIIAKDALSLCDIVHPYATYNEENWGVQSTIEIQQSRLNVFLLAQHAWM